MMDKTRKKTPQKTKELSVAIAEASSTAGIGKEEEIQINTPRKRGRPRKIVLQEELEESSKSEEVKKEIQTHVAQKQDDDEETSLMAENSHPRRKARRKGKPHKSI